MVVIPAYDLLVRVVFFCVILVDFVAYLDRWFWTLLYDLNSLLFSPFYYGPICLLEEEMITHFWESFRRVFLQRLMQKLLDQWRQVLVHLNVSVSDVVNDWIKIISRKWMVTVQHLKKYYPHRVYVAFVVYSASIVHEPLWSQVQRSTQKAMCLFIVLKLFCETEIGQVKMSIFVD